VNLLASEAHRTFEGDESEHGNWQRANLGTGKADMRKHCLRNEVQIYETAFGVRYISYKAVMELTPNRIVTHKHSGVGRLDYRLCEPPNFGSYAVGSAVCVRALNVISRRGGSTQLE
jgi:hypothetical protein